MSNAVNTPDQWSNVCSKSQIVSAKLKRKNRKKKEEKKNHLLGRPYPVKLTGLQICSGMSSLKLWEISNALYIKTTLPIISSGTCLPKLNRLKLRPKNIVLHTTDILYYFTAGRLFSKTFFSCFSLGSAGIRCFSIKTSYAETSKHQIPAFAGGLWKQVTRISANELELCTTVTELSVFNSLSVIYRGFFFYGKIKA